MSTPTTGSKKAVHVKWAGKTIALGTFPSAEADEKCARAKALTRAWRSTMRPKPSRDWVMLELERLNVRVVSGRLGRKEDEGEEGGGQAAAAGGSDRKASIGWSASDDFDNMMGQPRRSSSIGFNNRSGSLGLGSDEASRRPFVGGGSAAAYEAARADHYGSMGGKGADGRGSMGMGGSGGMAGMSVNPNQHYEMLKLHHMNLLNEIQETTLMMNLYQQQQLQQQQEQLQREGDAEGSGPLPEGNSSGAGGFGGAGGADSMGSGAQQASSMGGMVPADGASDKADELVTAQNQQQELEERLKAIKEDIASRQKEADELEAVAEKQEEGTKRKADDEDEKEESEGADKKRVKTEKDEKKKDDDVKAKEEKGDK